MSQSDAARGFASRVCQAYLTHIYSTVKRVPGRFGPESFGSWVISAQIVSAKFGGSFRPDFF